MSSGLDEEPEVALSLPLGAGRLTREWLPEDPPGRRRVSMLRDWLDTELAPAAATVLDAGPPTSRWRVPRRFVRWRASPALRRRLPDPG